jgi:hypothetical protein
MNIRHQHPNKRKMNRKWAKHLRRWRKQKVNRRMRSLSKLAVRKSLEDE